MVTLSNLFKSTLVSGALATLAIACGGVEDAPAPERQLRDLGSFTIDFNADGTATMKKGIYSQLVLGVDGNPLTNPPGTVQAITTSAIVGNGGNGCPAAQNCFTVEITNFTGQPQGGVFMGIDSISGGGGRTFLAPDGVPAGVTAALGGRNFGNIGVGGSASADLDFTIPNPSGYSVNGRFWGDDGSVSHSYVGPTVEVANSAQYGVSIGAVPFAANEFAPGARVQDVNVTVTWDKTGGTCATPIANSALHQQTSFRLLSPAGTRANLVRSSPTPSTYLGNTDIAPVTVTFDQDAAGLPPLGGIPANGNFRPHAEVPAGLDVYINELPAGNWILRAGSGSAPLCVVGYSVAIIAN